MEGAAFGASHPQIEGHQNIKFLLLQTHVRGDGNASLLRSDEKLTAFLELESAIRIWITLPTSSCVSTDGTCAGGMIDHSHIRYGLGARPIVEM